MFFFWLASQKSLFVEAVKSMRTIFYVFTVVLCPSVGTNSDIQRYFNRLVLIDVLNIFVNFFKTVISLEFFQDFFSELEAYFLFTYISATDFIQMNYCETAE